jgi:hypothetical protein
LKASKKKLTKKVIKCITKAQKEAKRRKYEMLTFGAEIELEDVSGLCTMRSNVFQHVIKADPRALGLAV